MKDHETFVEAALEAEREVAQYGLVYDADEVFAYIRARVRGLAASRPSPGKLSFIVS